MNTKKGKKETEEKICLLENNLMDATNKIVRLDQKLINKNNTLGETVYQYMVYQKLRQKILVM